MFSAGYKGVALFGHPLFLEDGQRHAGSTLFRLAISEVATGDSLIPRRSENGGLPFRLGLQVPVQFCVCSAAGIRAPRKAADAWLAIR
jgi:hypothetical protein